MELFTYLMAKNDHNTSVNKDLFSYLLGKNQSGTYTDYSGTSLSINNTKKGKMKVNLLGNTSQTGTPTPSSPIPVNVVSGDNTIVSTGKNLFNPTYQVEHQYLTDGTELIPANNNYSLSNGIITSVNNVNAVGRRFLNKTNLSAGTYTISGKVKFNNASSYHMFNSVRDMGTLTDIKPSFEINVGSTTGTFNFSFTLSEDVGNVSISLQPMTANDGTLELSELQLEKSATATTYEPYTSTSYPIHLSGEELFDYSYQVEKQYASNGTQESSQRYTLSNNVITISRDKSNYGRYFMNKLELTAGTYSLSFIPTLSGSTKEITYSIKDLDNQVTYVDENITITDGIKTTLQFTLSQTTTISIELQPRTSASGTLTFTKAHLNYSNKIIELCKIGNYQDSFFKAVTGNSIYDNLDSATKESLTYGEWYLEKKIGKVVLDGSESWGKSGASTSSIFVGSTNITNAIDGYGLSNLFTYSSQVGIGYFTIYNNGANLRLCLDNNTISTIEAFKTWLSTHNTIVYYVLATPTYTPITGTLKDELEAVYNAKSYKGTTNINQINNDLPFNMDVSIKVGS